MITLEPAGCEFWLYATPSPLFTAILETVTVSSVVFIALITAVCILVFHGSTTIQVVLLPSVTAGVSFKKTVPTAPSRLCASVVSNQSIAGILVRFDIILLSYS